jgi:hypothetical protein
MDFRLDLTLPKGMVKELILKNLRSFTATGSNEKISTPQNSAKKCESDWIEFFLNVF